MKRLFTGIIILLIVFLFISKSPKQQETNPYIQREEMTITPTPHTINSINIEYAEHSYVLIYEKITNAKISLIPNFTEKQTASSLSLKNACTIASSGGFYTKQNTP
ncbi:MAG: hypothetical protein WC774_05990, partial [Candidatus Gracilibacteria bacterium]